MLKAERMLDCASGKVSQREEGRLPSWAGVAGGMMASGAIHPTEIHGPWVGRTTSHRNVPEGAKANLRPIGGHARARARHQAQGRVAESVTSRRSQNAYRVARPC